MIEKTQKIKTGNIGARKNKLNKKKIIRYAIIIFFMYLYAIFHLITAIDKYTITGISKGFKTMFTDPLNIHIKYTSDTVQFIILALLFYVAGIMYIYMTIVKNMHDAKGIEKDSSEWNENYEDYNIRKNAPYGVPTHEEYDEKAKKMVDSYDNMIMSQNVRLGMDNKATKRNGNVICFGGSGTGKTFFEIKPNLLQCHSSYVITDPSGELLKSYGHFFQNMGYKLKILNLKEMIYSNHYNPLAYLRKDEDVITLVKIIMDSTQPEDSKPDQFFDSATEALLQALIFYLWRNFPDEANLPNIMKMIEWADADEDGKSNKKNVLDELFEDEHKNNPDSLAYQQYCIYKKGTGKTLKSILISTGVRLTKFNLPSVKRLTSTDDIELDKFGSDRIALFLILPTGDNGFNFLSAMLYSQLFSQMYYKAETECLNQTHIYEKKISYVAKKKEDYTIKDKLKSKFSFFKPPIVQHEAQGRFLSSHEDDEDAKEYIKDMKKAKIISKDKITGKKEDKNMPVLAIKRGDNYEILKEFEAETPKRNVELLKQWRNMYKNYTLVKFSDVTLPEPVRLMLDEFKNVGKIPGFEEYLSTVRKYKIMIFIVYQSLSQLKAMYEKNWGEIIDNCDTTIYLGGQGTETAEEISKLLGNMTITTKGTNVSDGSKGDSKSYNSQERALATTAELIRMEEDDCVVLIRGEKPFNEKKYFCPEHPRFKMTADGGGKIFELRDYYEKKNTADNVEKISKLDYKVKTLNANNLKEKETVLQEIQNNGIFDENTLFSMMGVSTTKKTKTA